MATVATAIRVLGVLAAVAGTGCDGAPFESMGTADAGAAPMPDPNPRPSGDAGAPDATGTTSGYIGKLPERGTAFRILWGGGPQRGMAVPLALFHSELAQANAVCLGEQHDNDDFHAAQMLAFDRLLKDAAPDQQMALGMEMFQTPFQQPLDDFAAAKIDERTLLLETQYKQRWGFDFAYYRPLVTRAVAAKAAPLALNAAREITTRVSAAGGVAGLTEEERAQLPELDLTNAQHRAWFREAIGSSAPASEARLEAIYNVQVIWDETMADTAARWLKGTGRRQIAILAGTGHCMNLAIPLRMRRRGIAKVVSVRPVPDDPAQVKKVLDEGFSDFIVPFAPR